MRKIVINTRFGGFGLSHAGEDLWASLKDVRLIRKGNNLSYIGGEYFSSRSIARDDEALVQVVETLGEAASGAFADLKIVEIPDDVEWEIDEYNGKDWVTEKHRTWGQN